MLPILFLWLADVPQTSDQLEDARRQVDGAQRDANNQHDWWLVSTTGFEKGQHRFYIDRNEMTSMQPISRAWVEHYALERGKLVSDKVLLVAKCDDNEPQIMFKMTVAYGDGSSPPQSQADKEWRDVIPGSSQQTLWRFICHSQPANAIVFIPDGPSNDARRYFASQ